MADESREVVSFDCEVVVHPVPKGLTAHKMQRALRGKAGAPERPTFPDIEGAPSLKVDDGLVVAFTLRPGEMVGDDMGAAVVRALSIVRRAAEAEGFDGVQVGFVSAERFD